MKVIREHKDRLFKFIFQEKEKLLELYNALNGTDYGDSKELEVTTLEDVIYMKMRNDISFILDCQLSLFEHQSTDNPNMPLRGLLYFAKQYEKYVSGSEFNLYGTKLIPIPTPQYIIFYNGDHWKGERKVLKLSDSFANNRVGGCMELEALQLNVNYGHNKEIMEKCKPLWEYAVFVGKVKRYSETMDIVDAINRAVKECIDENVLRDILISQRSEVVDMLLTEYDEEKTMRLFRKEFEEEAALKVKEAEEKVVRAEEKVIKLEAEVEGLKRKLKEVTEK